MTRSRSLSHVPATRAVYTVLGCAAGVLVLGTAVYLFDGRSLPVFPALHVRLSFARRPRVLGTIGQCFPSFAHAYSFALFTVAVIGFRVSHLVAASVGWFCIESLFEIGQHPVASGWVVALAARRQESSLLLRGVARSLSSGTFDPLDLVAAALGVGLAAATVLVLRGKE